MFKLIPNFALPGLAVVALIIGFSGCGADSPQNGSAPAVNDDHGHDHDHHGHDHDHHGHDHDHDHDHDVTDVRAAVDAAQQQIAADPQLQRQLAEYPLETCIVMAGEGLEGHGGPVDFVHEGQVVRFCCAACVREFLDDPDEFLPELEAARQRAGEDAHE